MNNRFINFFRLESAGGILLILSSALALLFANSSHLIPYYNYFLHYDIGIVWENSQFTKPILFWINDALMAVFFFIVGLEIKREFMDGNLARRDQALLPIFAAIGGIAAPALIYFGINIDNPSTLKGWAIPSATDIAFALGILALLGSRVPLSLKVFLTAVAIIDDLVAILIIAFFYTGGVDWGALSVTPVIILALYLFNRYHVTSLIPYLLWGFMLWINLKTAGLHPTLAGVIVAFSIPLKTKEGESLSQNLEHALHPWVAFLILPLFGFANAGVSFEGITIDSFSHPLTLGIIAGLFIGKQIGIFSVVYLCVKLGFAKLPKGATWLQMYAVAILCGIGFTMSLFIGTLAFDSVEQARELRLGVLAGSFLSAIVGYSLFHITSSSKPTSKRPLK